MLAIKVEIEAKPTSRTKNQPDSTNLDILKWLAVKELSSLRRPTDLFVSTECDSCSSDEDELNLLLGVCNISIEPNLYGDVSTLNTDLATRARIFQQENVIIEKARKLLTHSVDKDILDWDARIEISPPRPSGTIRVKLEYRGRSKPIPVDDL